MITIFGSSFYNLYNFYMFLHILITCLLFFAYIIYTFLSVPTLSDVLNTMLQTSERVLILLIMAYIIERIWNDTVKRQRTRLSFNLRALHVICSMYAITMRVLVCCFTPNFKLIVHMSFFFLTFPIAINYRYHRFHRCEVFYFKRPILIFSICLLHLLILITSIILPILYSRQDPVAIIIVQFMFFPMCLVTNIDWVMVFLKDVEWKGGVEAESLKKVAPVEADVEINAAAWGNA